jgi:hypothetical protein
MSGGRRPWRAAGLAAAALVLALPAVLVLGAPALAVRIALSDSPGLREFLTPWLWASAAAVPLALLVGRLSARRPGLAASALRAGLLLAVLNGIAYVQLARHAHPGVLLPHVWLVYGPGALAAAGALAALHLWDRRLWDRRRDQAARKLAR